MNLLSELCHAAREYGLWTHLDAARVWSAMIAIGRSCKEIAAPFDSLSTCFSKGLGPLIGSALCGSRDFITRAARNRKCWAVVCGLFAFDQNLPLLRQDNENASWL